MGQDIRTYDSVRDAVWFHYKHRRMYPCDEWKSYKEYILNYSGQIHMAGLSGWEFADVFAGKHSDRTIYVLTKEVTRDEWYQHMATYEEAYSYRREISYVNTDEQYLIVLSARLWGIVGYSDDKNNPEFERYVENFAHSNTCRELLRDLNKYEGGTPVAEVTFNEYKDADQGVITITSGRSQLQFTLHEAAQLLNAIPEAMRGYRDARVNAVQDQIKSLNEALAALQSIPTQTNAGQ